MMRVGDLDTPPGSQAPRQGRANQDTDSLDEYSLFSKDKRWEIPAPPLRLRSS